MIEWMKNFSVWLKYNNNYKKAVHQLAETGILFK